MKILILSLSMVLAAFAPAEELADSVALVPVSKLRTPAPLFFSVAAKSLVTVAEDHTDYEITASFRVHQGKPETLTLGLNGEGEITAVEGEKLRTWTVRKEADGSRFLDLKPQLPEEGKSAEENYTYRIFARHYYGRDAGTPVFQVLLPAQGSAVGFSAETELRHSGDALPAVTEAAGLLALQGGDDDVTRFGGSGRLTVRVGKKGASARPVELTAATLEGNPSADATSMSFILRATLNVAEAGKAADLLESAALSGEASGDGWHVRLRREDDHYVHEIVGDRTGSFPISIPFEVPIARNGDRRSVGFIIPAGVVVPVHIASLGDDISFDKDQ
ncbi:MAG: hypothetical protein JWO82_2948, partial [Akkermansiaceae bacterium]|nr:hypothetical protein [Akkermansiaceae bacterium]